MHKETITLLVQEVYFSGFTTSRLCVFRQKEQNEQVIFTRKGAETRRFLWIVFFTTSSLRATPPIHFVAGGELWPLRAFLNHLPALCFLTE